jgi:hypothetical protein
MNCTPDRATSPPRTAEVAHTLDHERDVLEAIRDTRFGTVEIVIHQSKIVQITRSEKVRFEPR